MLRRHFLLGTTALVACATLPPLPAFAVSAFPPVVHSLEGEVVRGTLGIGYLMEDGKRLDNLLAVELTENEVGEFEFFHGYLQDVLSPDWDNTPPYEVIREEALGRLCILDYVRDHGFIVTVPGEFAHTPMVSQVGVSWTA